MLGGTRTDDAWGKRIDAWETNAKRIDLEKHELMLGATN